MMTFSPLHLSILLHYNGSLRRYSADDPQHANSPAVHEYTQALVDLELIEKVDNEDYYRTTEKGEVHVEALCDLPLPELKWVSESNPPLQEISYLEASQRIDELCPPEDITFDPDNMSGEGRS